MLWLPLLLALRVIFARISLLNFGSFLSRVRHIIILLRRRESEREIERMRGRWGENEGDGERELEGDGEKEKGGEEGETATYREREKDRKKVVLRTYMWFNEHFASSNITNIYCIAKTPNVNDVFY